MTTVSLIVCVLLSAALVAVGCIGGRAWRRERSAGRERDRIFALAPEMLCVADFDGTFRCVNPAWERTLGFKVEELSARPFLDFVHPDDRESTVAQMALLLEGADTVAFENRYVCKDGSYRWFLWNATPVAEERRIYAAARDITDRKLVESALLEAKQAAEYANRELEGFSYSVSHDLRAPLRSIEGFSQALVEDCGAALDVVGRRHVERIQAATNAMSALIADLLELSRLGCSELACERVDLGAIVRAIFAELRQRDPARVADLSAGDDAIASGDPRFLRIALQNLIENAWKFTRGRPHAHVEFGVAEVRGETIFFLKDDGVGFDMAFAGRLFGVFQRLHPTREFEGTGVGLATVQRIVHRHGGRIWAESTVGGGATFSFTLAAAVSPGSRALESRPIEAEAPLAMSHAPGSWGNG